MKKLSLMQIEETRAAVQRCIEDGLETISNTPLGVNVTYRKDNISVSTTMSQLLIGFKLSDFEFICKIPLWVNGQYDLTSCGDLLTSFNNYRFLFIKTWVEQTLMNQEDFQKWVAYSAMTDVEQEEQQNVSQINFAITVMHTKNRFSRIEGEEVWKYIDMPTPHSMKIIDPDDESEIVGARLEIEYAGTGEIQLDKICEAFRHQYLENK